MLGGRGAYFLRLLMTEATLVTGINEWLVDQALSEPDIVGMFEGLCNRIHAIGIPLGRARLTWPTLHPLFQAETILWARGKPTEFEQFKHQENRVGSLAAQPDEIHVRQRCERAPPQSRRPVQAAGLSRCWKMSQSRA